MTRLDATDYDYSDHVDQKRVIRRVRCVGSVL